ncbi:hypothetical protein [Runella zeae]|uniref:hypothetical protein n=1 Tax=Runella zeae TaxID=94255 RepID=UPI0023559D6B|nr:hypothetical protein [Runella zeae]
MANTHAGSLKSFCIGYLAGLGTALSFGWGLGPVGIGVVIVGAAACVGGITDEK